MSALNSMVRVHRWILDEKRQKLGDLERLADRMRDDLRRIDEDIEREREIARNSSEAGSAFSAFLVAARMRRSKIQESLDNLQREVELARGEVGDAFQELKQFETARDNAVEKEVSERKRREQLSLDEMGVGLYRRRGGASGKG
ncbi:MAG: flagellar export protein FliJ [Kiloniellales bacterium]|nr:flagellar export protein FliJ [Kiloniellales bacterium]